MQSFVTECLDKLVTSKNMRRRARKSFAKWLSNEAITAKRQRHRLERKRNRVKLIVKPTVLPAAMQTDTSIGREGITYDLNLKPVLILVSAGRKQRYYYMPIIDQLNKLLLLTILPFVNNFLTFFV